jgi:SAM-dependent methyltransferase
MTMATESDFKELQHFDESVTPIGRWLVLRIAQTEFHLFKSLLTGADARILEIGPGIGSMALTLRKAGYDQFYTAIEPNQVLLKRLQEQKFQVKSYLLPMMDEKDSSYDCIYLSNVFEHLKNVSEASTFIQEVYRVLKPGGILCISCPDYVAWKGDFFNSDYTHTNVTTVRRTMQMFTDNGLAVRNYYYLSGFVIGGLAFLMSFFVRLLFIGVNTNHLDAKLYKLKLTFSLRFLIIGQKVFGDSGSMGINV